MSRPAAPWPATSSPIGATPSDEIFCPSLRVAPAVDDAQHSRLPRVSRTQAMHPDVSRECLRRSALPAAWSLVLRHRHGTDLRTTLTAPGLPRRDHEASPSTPCVWFVMAAGSRGVLGVFD